MARVTVEDCLKNVENRFDLVLKASKRAHALEVGAVEPLVPLDNDKPTVVALREIAAGYDVMQDLEKATEVVKAAPSVRFAPLANDIETDPSLHDI